MNDEREAKLAEQYRLQGVVRTGHDGMEVELVGGKFNMTDVAARIGLGQLPHLAEFTAKRRELARAYFEEFEAPAVRALGIGAPASPISRIRTGTCSRSPCPRSGSTRPGPQSWRTCAAGIGTGVHYPALHLFALYRRMGWKRRRLSPRRICGAQPPHAPPFPGHDPLRRQPRGAGAGRGPSNPPESMSAVPEISIVIPVYNEELNLPLLFARLYPVLDGLGRKYEVIFTNDGSADTLPRAPEGAVRGQARASPASSISTRTTASTWRSWRPSRGSAAR